MPAPVNEQRQKELSTVRDLVRRGMLSLHMPLSDQQLDLLGAYYALLLSGNEQVNLTAITDPREVAVKHFLDCLAPLHFLPPPRAARLVDVGSGAGFPGIPLKIARSDLEIVLVESVRKKADFLRLVIKELDLSGIVVVERRAEEFARQENVRESFDLSVCRAVAALPVLLEYCLPLLKVGGFFWALKGPSVEREFPVDHALQILGGRLNRVFHYALPFTGDERRLVTVEKVTPVPDQYPRKAGVPVKRPLK